MTDKNSKIPAHCYSGLLPPNVINSNTGDALTLLALDAAMKEIIKLNQKVQSLETEQEKIRCSVLNGTRR